MKKSAFVFFAALGLLAQVAQAATPAEQAFEKLKSLAGSWKVTKASENEAQGNVITYTVRSGGSALEEVSGEMVTMYHMDGDTLVATHYCELGNQPRMRASEFALPVQSVNFVFQDITNAKPGDSHISGIRFDWKDDNHVTQSWEFTNKDGSKGTEVFETERVPAAVAVQVAPRSMVQK
jgi:hypothetical protein